MTLRNADLNVERVRQRVRNGGHAVEENKIRERRERSFKQLPWFLTNADLVLIYDNSGAQPKLIGRKQGRILEIDPAAPDEIKGAALSLRR